MRKSLLATLITAAAALAVAPAAHADDYFLKIDGVTGETQMGKVTDAIQIKSFEWSAESTTTIGSASGGAGAGKATLNDLVITKTVDSTSPVLMQRVAQGTVIPGMELVVRKAGATGAGVVYQRYFFTPVFATKQAHAGSEGGEGITETLTFKYGALQMSNARQSPNGTLAPPVALSWNQMTNSDKLLTTGMPNPGTPSRF
jgi:type VI secretion system secreted protein Hcp